MYDDVTVANYPRDAEVAAGYVNGNWPTAALGLQAQCPNAIIVTIDVNGTRPDADFLDMEFGDATPQMCPPWSRQHGPGAGIYCSLSRVMEVVGAFGGVLPPDMRLWTAHYTNPARPHICDVSCGYGLTAEVAAHIVATQYADPPASGGEYDVSLCAVGWPS